MCRAIGESHPALVLQCFGGQIEDPDLAAPQGQQDSRTVHSAGDVEDLLAPYVADELMPLLDMKDVGVRQPGVAIDDFGRHHEILLGRSIAIEMVVPGLVVGDGN